MTRFRVAETLEPADDRTRPEDGGAFCCAVFGCGLLGGCLLWTVLESLLWLLRHP